LVTGPFCSLSSDFNHLVEFIARERAMQTMKLRGKNSAVAFAVHRRALVRRIGLLTFRGWAQHIVDRWRDAVSNRPAASHSTQIDLAADEFLSDNPHRGGYHTACTCLKHLALLFFKLCLFYTVRITPLGVGKSSCAYG